MNSDPRPITVLQFGLSYAPVWRGGGPPRIMYDYARHLLDAGFRVMVLTGEDNRPRPEDNWAGFPAGLELFYVRKLGGWRAQYYFDYSWEELTSFFDAHWREIDFIHLYQTRSIFNVAALWAAQRYGIRLVLSSFGSMPRRRSAAKFIYDRFCVLPFSRHAELLLAQTRHECEVYRKYGGRTEHIHLLPLAVDLSKRPAITPDMRRAFRAKFGIPESAWLFVFVGRLHPTKGVGFLVNCFAEVARVESTAHLAIVGHDEGTRDTVEKTIAARGLDARVTLCGPLYDAERWQAYAGSDCFVILPEIYEETSLASLEALACGTPVITNQRADVPGLEEHGAGWIVSGGDGAATIQAMIEAVRTPRAHWAGRRDAAARLAREKFEIGAVTREFAGLLRQAAMRPVTEQRGPLLVGPLPGAVGTSGQAACFKMLYDGLRERGLAGPVVNLGSSETGSITGKPTVHRALEYVSILAKFVWHSLPRTRVVYITMAQSRHGFFRDAVMIVLARLSGNDVVLHLHGGNYDRYYESEPGLVRALIRAVLRQTSCIIVLSESLRGCFAFDPRLADRLCVVQNSLPAAEVPAARPARRVQPGGGPTLLYLSNLIESKGYLEVLEVLHHLRVNEGLAARAVFCGNFLANPSDDVRVQDTTQARGLFDSRAAVLGVSAQITYRGSIGGADKQRVLDESDFLVFPTRYDNEGQPLVLIEALAHGLPAVTTNYRANGVMVVDGVTGCLVDWRDTAGMARRIAALWRDPAAYETMSVNCRRRFEAGFTPAAHIAAMERVIFSAAT